MTPSLNGFTGRVLLSLHQQPRSYSTYHQYAQSIQHRDRSRSLIDAHSPRQPPVSPASPAFSAPESYITMHASYLIICPRFTLRVAAVTEKNGGQTDGQTHTHTHTQTHLSQTVHTHRPTAITLAAHARRRGG